MRETGIYRNEIFMKLNEKKLGILIMKFGKS